MEATACQASCRLVTKKRLEVRSEWGKRRCLTCLSAAYKTWSSTSHPIHNPSCNQIIEGISVRFLTSSRKSCIKMASMASAAKKVSIFGKGFYLRPYLSPHMSCVKVKSKGFDPWGDAKALVGHMLQGSCSPTVDDTYG